jgi:hypothetical protein
VSIGTDALTEKPATMIGILVATKHSLSRQSGGQQICTQEYVEALQTAGFTLEHVVFDLANGIKEKLLRRLDPRPYRYSLPGDLADRAAAVANTKQATHIFLNTVDLAPLAAELKQRGSWQIVMLSHGLESVDFVHTLRTQNWRNDFFGLSRTQELKLGRQIIEECKQRIYIDKVVCLAKFEAEIERWLGAREILVVPRIVRPAILNWTPVEGRSGFVGRLDHPPNLEGLLMFLDEMEKIGRTGLDVRIVGAPHEYGARLANRYPFVSYLGMLSDADLTSEAATWTCAINPVFCYARGASTKLAVLAGWGIPLVTTPQGERGYEWQGDHPIACATAGEFALAVRDIATNHTERSKARAKMMRLLSSPLNIEQIADRLDSFLRSPINSRNSG